MGAEEELASLPAVTSDAAARLSAAGLTAADLTAGRVSRADLVEAGVAEGDADRIRRAHGLAWSFHVGDGDLVRRAARVRGLMAGERAWVAASEGDWEGAGRVAADGAETDLAEVPGISDAEARRLAAAGVTSVEHLAGVDAADLADVLDVDVRHLRTWRVLARERAENGR